MCLNIGTHKSINFSFETNEKLMALGVPILKHFRVHNLYPITKRTTQNDFSLNGPNPVKVKFIK